MELEFGTELKTFSIKSLEKNPSELKHEPKENPSKIDSRVNCSKIEESELTSESIEDVKTKIEEKKVSKENEKTSSTECRPKTEEPKKNTVKCSKCGILLGFPQGSYFVSCPQCTTVTATVELLTLSCQFCRLMSYFPKSALSVQCSCGAIYKVK